MVWSSRVSGPWSSQFDPPLDEGGAGGIGSGGSNEGAGEGAVPGERVRKMEVRANEAFDVYRELYYEGGVSSVYFWNLDDGFAGVVLLKKCELYISLFFLFAIPPCPAAFFILMMCHTYLPETTKQKRHYRPANIRCNITSLTPKRHQQRPRRLGLDSRIRSERARAHLQLPPDLDCDQRRTRD